MRRARIQLGSRAQLQEQMWRIDLFGWAETLLQDLRYGVRSLSTHKTFALTALISLTLGLGANIAIFNIINALLLRSLPIEDPSRRVQIKSKDLGDYFTNPIWEQIRDRQKSFEGVLAYGGTRFDLSISRQHCSYSPLQILVPSSPADEPAISSLTR